MEATTSQFDEMLKILISEHDAIRNVDHFSVLISSLIIYIIILYIRILGMIETLWSVLRNSGFGHAIWKRVMCHL